MKKNTKVIIDLDDKENYCYRMKVKYKCEKCKLEFKDEDNKFSVFKRCKCGGRAFKIDFVGRVRPMTII